MKEEYLHDLKRIAELMKALTTAMDKLFIDIERKEKGGKDVEKNT